MEKKKDLKEREVDRNMIWQVPQEGAIQYSLVRLKLNHWPILLQSVIGRAQVYVLEAATQ